MRDINDTGITVQCRKWFNAVNMRAKVVTGRPRKRQQLILTEKKEEKKNPNTGKK